MALFYHNSPSHALSANNVSCGPTAEASTFDTRADLASLAGVPDDRASAFIADQLVARQGHFAAVS
jgi:hypothetical protein